jgi:hypothetical protein
VVVYGFAVHAPIFRAMMLNAKNPNAPTVMTTPENIIHNTRVVSALRKKLMAKAIPLRDAKKKGSHLHFLKQCCILLITGESIPPLPQQDAKPGCSCPEKAEVQQEGMSLTF